MVTEIVLNDKNDSTAECAVTLASVDIERGGSGKKKTKKSGAGGVEEKEKGEVKIVQEPEEPIREGRKREDRSSHAHSKFAGVSNVEEFLVQFKLDDPSLSGEQMLALVESKLEGEAALWFKVAKLDGVSDWGTMKEEMIRPFQKKGPYKYYEYSELLDKGPCGGIKSFFYKLRIVAADINHDFSDGRLGLRN